MGEERGAEAAVSGVGVLSARADGTNVGGALFALSILSGLLLGVVFDVVLHVSVPPTNAAYGTLPFSHPLEATFVCWVGSAGGILGFPFAWVFLRRTRLGQAWWRVMLAGAVTVAVVTPLWGPFAVPAAFVTMVLAMAWCKRRYPLERESDATDAHSTPSLS